MRGRVASGIQNGDVNSLEWITMGLALSVFVKLLKDCLYLFGFEDVMSGDFCFTIRVPGSCLDPDLKMFGAEILGTLLTVVESASSRKKIVSVVLEIISIC